MASHIQELKENFDAGAPGAAASDRLVRATLLAWANSGRAGISARQLSQAASLPASAINYHFGNLEQLLCIAQDAAIGRATAWCDAQRATLGSGEPLDPEAFAPLLAALMDEWCTTQRTLALAWRECHLLAARNPIFQPAAERWRQLWDDFWSEITGRFGLARFADVTAQFFDGEALLHLIRWQRPLDRAALGELCTGWNAWLLGVPAGPGRWHAFAKTEAIRLRPHLADEGPVARAIGSAAADLLGRDGASGVTHRAVADAAGVTLGTVTYHFRTSADLLQAAFNAIYRSLTADLMAERAERDTAELATTRRHFLDYAGEKHAPATLLAFDELLGAAARDPEYLSFAAVLRYSRGETSSVNLSRTQGVRKPISNLDGMLCSVWSQGLRRHILATPEASRDQTATRSVALFLELLSE